MPGPEDESTELFNYDRFLLDDVAIPSVSEPQTLETSASDPPLRSILDRPPTPFSTRVHRPRPTLSLLPLLHWVQSFVFNPFLEETHSKIFQQEIYVYPNELKWR